MPEENADVVGLKGKRGQLKTQLTILEKALDKFDADPEANFDRFDFSGRLERHKLLGDKFEEIQGLLEISNLDEDIEYEHLEERSLFEDRYFAINGRLKNHIELNKAARERHMQTSQSVIGNTATINVDTSHSDNVTGQSPSHINELSTNQHKAQSNAEDTNRVMDTQNTIDPGNAGNFYNFIPDPNLPKLGLPSFAGTFDTWLSFRDIFASMVHENKQVPTIFKFLYLKSCVTGEAEEVINSLQSSEENYAVAWKLLTDRYDNQKFIAENHMKAIFDCPSVSKEFSVRSLIDTLLKHTRALRALKLAVDNWDLPLIHIIKSKLNNYTRERWEEFTGNSKIPTTEQLIAFLERRAQIDSTRSVVTMNSNKSTFPKEKHSANSSTTLSRNFHSTNPSTSHDQVLSNQQSRSCVVCKGEHKIFQCPQFLKLSPQDRIIEAKKASLCFNCLRSGHRPAECTLSGCKQCQRKHNTLLHIYSVNKIESKSAENLEGSPQKMYTLNTSSEVYLGTAIVDILDGEGNYRPCRVMLDGGAQSCAITDSCASRLGLCKKPFHIPLLSIDEMKTDIKFQTSAIIKSRFNNKKQNLNLLIVQIISKATPSVPRSRCNFSIPNSIFLADPEFHEPAPIDILIGAEFAYAFLLSGQISLKGHSAILQKTILGWVVAGRVFDKKVKVTTQETHTICNFVQNHDLSILWELENVKTASCLSVEEQECEKHYQNNVQRDVSGRYIVKLPFNKNLNDLGDSRSMAFRRFYSTENKLVNNSSLQKDYSQCMNSYICQGHMTEVNDKNSQAQGYYIPHLAVIKNDSLLTKTRVVFDASAKSSSGISLNDCLMTGSRVQDDLFSIVVRFRSFLFTLTADIEQMYRQIKVNHEDSNFQKILWRENKNQPIKVYALNRVTFGTAAAPFLATRTLLQLSNDESVSHPKTAAILKRDFYVDDLLTGAQSYQEALDLRNELIQLLLKGGFNLRKWGSNDPRLTDHLSNDSNDNHMSLDPTKTVKTLGIYWDHKHDSILYKVYLPDSKKSITKRSVLSESAKLFDPLGLLGPVVVAAKIFIQSLWESKIGWDEPIPHELLKFWTEYRLQLILLNKFSIPRCISVPNVVETQIHGFCDASEKAYGACLYLRTTDTSGKHNSSLICAKSRVTPLKPITIPKLEQCAAVLLTHLLDSTLTSLQISTNKVFLWSDSTIVLSWIKSKPENLKIFVANRVSEIQSVEIEHQWIHVPTKDNPADLISRGQMPKEFLQSNIWLHGPRWLTLNSDKWPQMAVLNEEVPETKTAKNPLVALTLTVARKNTTRTVDNLVERFSSLRTLKNVVAYVQRFIHNIKINNKSQRRTGPLSTEELESAMCTILKVTQSTAFNKEIECLSKGELVDKKSCLLSLNPFLENGIIRVGGE